MPEEKIDLPLVTVITVTYNSGKYVKSAISSVIAQDYRNIEYIIIDDCSGDDTWEIINEFKDSRIRIIRNEQNLGEYNNRNKGIELATGKYLMFIDGDDIVFPHAIGSFVSYMEKFPEACMAIQKGYYNNLVFPFLLSPRQQYINYFFGKANLLVSSFASNFFKRELIQRFKLSNSYKSGDDEIRLRLAAFYPVLYVPGWMSWPRETPGQASSKIPEDVALLQSGEYLDKIMEDDNQISSDLILCKSIKNKLRFSYASFIKRTLLRGNISKAKKFSLKAGITIGEALVTRLQQNEYIDFMEGKSPENPYIAYPPIS